MVHNKTGQGTERLPLLRRAGDQDRPDGWWLVGLAQGLPQVQARPASSPLQVLTLNEINDAMERPERPAFPPTLPPATASGFKPAPIPTPKYSTDQQTWGHARKQKGHVIFLVTHAARRPTSLPD